MGMYRPGRTSASDGIWKRANDRGSRHCDSREPDDTEACPRPRKSGVFSIIIPSEQERSTIAPPFGDELSLHE